MRDDAIHSQVLSRSTFWSDLGTYKSLSLVEDYVNSIEATQLIHVLIPELVAVEKGFVDVEYMAKIIRGYPKCLYRDYLLGWLEKRGF